MTQLTERAARVSELAQRCRREIADPPHLAIPDVTRLGAVPTDPEELASYGTRLEAVARAMDTVEDAYASPLRTRAALRFRLGRARDVATRNGRTTSPTVRAGLTEASDAVEHVPCDLPRCESLVAIAEYLAEPLGHTSGGPS